MCAPSKLADAHIQPLRCTGKSPGKTSRPRSGNSALPGKTRAATDLAAARRARAFDRLQAKYPTVARRSCPAAGGRYPDPRHEPHRWSDFPPDYNLVTDRYPRGKPTSAQRAERAGRGYWLCPGSPRTATPAELEQLGCEPDTVERLCAGCGAKFETPTVARGRPQLYCSKTCWNRAAYKRKRDRERQVKPYPIVKCAAADCGVTFEQRRPNHVYCSQLCTQHAWGARQQHRHALALALTTGLR